ncbi:embryogenesis-associated protein EMB8 [Lactuca sativa]|uniref:embryogenesis-associated protein EMB8 n=1 Tax=Lactuca sativa TaxID=4236 RepID=UPI000CB97609|nr:embryogenesis-associated protein EMB8 [Lactuca sativa]
MISRNPPIMAIVAPNLITQSLFANSLKLRQSRVRRLPATMATPVAVTGTTADQFKDHHPSLEVLGGACDSFCPIIKTHLDRPYNSFPVFGSNCHLETIFAAFFRKIPDVKLKRECLRTQDDGTVTLDWVSGDTRNLPETSPILLLLPGLSGGSQDAYVRHMLVRARNRGWRVVVFNSRGCADSPVTTPQMYSASFLGDLDEVVGHITTRYPKANLYGTGWSMGANILVQYLGKESGARRFSGAVSMCNPFNLVMSDEDICQGFSRIYNRSLGKALGGILKKHLPLFEDIGGDYNIPLAANAETIREYDEGLTRISFGFKSVDEYLQKSCSADHIKNVQTPLLCIQARNDPIAPDRAIPREDIKMNPNCLLIVTPKGGHLGWVAGEDAPLGCPWTDPMVMDFLQHLENEKSGIQEATNSLLQPLEA